MRRGQHDGGVHLLQKTRALAQKFLPGRVLHRVPPGFGAGVQAGIGPDVAGLVRLTGLSLPEADDFGELFARRQRCGERIEPLFQTARRLAPLVTPVLRLVFVARGGRE